jgi:hypothetical protein
MKKEIANFTKIEIQNGAENERVMFESLNKGIYDIDFSIGICKKIVDICEKNKISSDHNLAFTLKKSLESLISYLQTQKCAVDKDPYVEIYCQSCGQKERVFKGDVDGWKKCKKCTPKLGFK